MFWFQRVCQLGHRHYLMPLVLVLDIAGIVQGFQHDCSSGTFNFMPRLVGTSTSVRQTPQRLDSGETFTETTTTTTRKSFLSTTVCLLSSFEIVLGIPPTKGQQESASAVAASNTDTDAPSSETPMQMFQLPSGIKYLDFEPGSGPTPEYGQLCSISYKGYIKLPANKNDANPKPQQFDQSSAYLIKHGNGRIIPGLDEGIHTLRVGGTRRIIIPPKLGYVTSGLGPIPEYPWDRSKLNNLLDQMVALRGGTVVFEVTLLSAIDDEADQGYYKDGSLTPDQFEQLRNTIQQRAMQASQQAAETQQAGN